MKKIILPFTLGLLVWTSSAQADGHAKETKDVTFAKQLWETMKQQKLVGPDRINVQPFKGNEPHGSIQQVVGTKITVNGLTGKVVVKANHGGKDISIQNVYSNPNQHLGAYTIMFQREKGYDAANQNWFWAKYNPKGEVDKTAKGSPIAGRIASCIGCHKAGGGADLEALTKQ